MNDDKKALRARFRAARQSLSAQVCRVTDADIASRILSTDAYRTADCILLYAAVQNEVDLTLLAREAFHDGKTVAYPRVYDNGRMVFHAVQSLSELSPDAYGIPAPPADAPAVTPHERTLMLLPALAYDRMGYRLGQGGGYYDRYLVTYPGMSIGIIREAGLIDVLPAEAHDRSVEVIITEKQIYKVK